jgi:hypothetical protein
MLNSVARNPGRTVLLSRRWRAQMYRKTMGIASLHPSYKLEALGADTQTINSHPSPLHLPWKKL